MAENKNAKKAAEAAAASEETSTPAEDARKAKKQSRWSLELCMKAAKRFTAREDWAARAPSSYKAAVAKGWDKQCSAHMKSAPVATKSKASAKPAKTPAPAKKKTGTKLPRSA